MPKVYSYIRFSTLGQRLGDSLRRQRDTARKWAEAKNYEFDEALVYRDLGVSGFRGSNVEHGALGLFIKAIHKGRVQRGDILVIEALDRLTRLKPLDAVELLTQIVRAGVTVVTATDGQEYSEERLNNELQCLMVAAVILSRGHEESRQKSLRLQAHFEARRNSGAAIISHVAPHWLRPENGRWVAVPEYAAVVRRVFEMAASGVGVTKIAKIFNAENIPIPRTTARAIGNGWHPSTLAALLKNRAVIGHYQPCRQLEDGSYGPVGELLTDHYPEIVPPETFWAVQDALSSRRTKGIGHRRDASYHHILAGMLRCAYCGGKMHLLRKRSANDDNHFYFVCPSAERGLTDCRNRINYRTLLVGAEERLKGKHKRGARYGLLPQLVEMIVIHRHSITETSAERYSQLEALALGAAEQLKELEERLERLLTAIEKGIVLPSEASDRIAQIRKHREECLASKKAVEIEMHAEGLGQELDWFEEQRDIELSKILPLLRPGNSEDTERAKLRTRLARVVESIFLFREVARVKLSGNEIFLMLPLSPDANMTKLGPLEYGLPEEWCQTPLSESEQLPG